MNITRHAHHLLPETGFRSRYRLLWNEPFYIEIIEQEANVHILYMALYLYF